METISGGCVIKQTIVPVTDDMEQGQFVSITDIKRVVAAHLSGITWETEFISMAAYKKKVAALQAETREALDQRDCARERVEGLYVELDAECRAYTEARTEIDIALAERDKALDKIKCYKEGGEIIRRIKKLEQASDARIDVIDRAIMARVDAAGNVARGSRTGITHAESYEQNRKLKVAVRELAQKAKYSHRNICLEKGALACDCGSTERSNAVDAIVARVLPEPDASAKVAQEDDDV